MSLRPCSNCAKRPPGKLCSVYWSWNLADRSRLAMLQRLCVDCYVVNVFPLADQDPSDTILCPVCHSPSGDDMDPIFARVYVPGQQDESLELATCPRCAVEVRSKAEIGAERLADRNPQFGGQAPKLTGAELWDSLGLRPERRNG